MKPRDRRALLIGSAALGLLLLVRAVPAARAAARDAANELDNTRGLLARAEALLLRAPALPDTLAARNARLVSLAPLLLEGASAAEAGAALAALLDGWAATRKVAVQRIQPGPPEPVPPFVRVAVAFEGESDLAGIAGLVAAIESTPQLLSVARLDIDAEPGNDGVQRLRIHLVVHGWALDRSTTP